MSALRPAPHPPAQVARPYLADQPIISAMRRALAALPGDAIEDATFRAIVYVLGAGVELADALRLDDEALKIEKMRRFTMGEMSIGGTLQ